MENRAFLQAAIVVGLLAVAALVGCSQNSPSRYTSVINDWTPTGLVTHFPKSLPASASNVKISAFPGLLQGGGWIQVRMTLPTAEVSKIYDDATKTAKDFYDGGSRYTSVNSKTNGLPGTSFHTSDSQNYTEFSNDYRVFVFAAKDAGGTPPFQSGNCYGVVVSKKHNEVIYYAENW